MRDPQPAPPGDDRVQIARPHLGEPNTLWLKRDGQISGDVLAEAHVAADRRGKPIIALTRAPQATARFREMTRDNVGRRFAIIVNNRIIMAPKIMEPIRGEKGQIDLRFTTKAAARAMIAEMMGTKAP